MFWKQFYQSAERFLLVKDEKHYFIFTDDTAIEEQDRIHKIYQRHLDFPLGSLLRFEMFLTIEDRLLPFDYIYFFNANLHVMEPIGDEILPGNIQSGLTGTIHPGLYHSSPFWYPYERNKMSTAYIHPKYKKYRYFMGGLNGGTAAAYLNLIRVCNQNIQTDLQNGFMAVYHDESHINRYFAGKEVLELSPSYGYPEEYNLPFQPKIMILNKIKHGGSYFDKVPDRSYMARTRLFMRKVISGIKWYL
jgi:hypothetical protein